MHTPSEIRRQNSTGLGGADKGQAYRWIARWAGRAVGSRWYTVAPESVKRVWRLRAACYNPRYGSRYARATHRDIHWKARKNAHKHVQRNVH